MDKPESGEEDDEDEDEDDEGAPEIDLDKATITPEAQEILDTFANQLLNKLEEYEKREVVQLGKEDGGEEADACKGKKGQRKGEDCICCRLEAVSARPPTKKQAAAEVAATLEVTVAGEGAVGEAAAGEAVGMPILTDSPLKKASKGTPKSKEVDAAEVVVVEKTPETVPKKTAITAKAKTKKSLKTVTKGTRKTASAEDATKPPAKPSGDAPTSAPTPAPQSENPATPETSSPVDMAAEDRYLLVSYFCF